MPIYALGERRPVLPASGSCWIAPDASVIGDVTLGEDVGIWFAAVLRADHEPIVIGAGSNVQDGAVLHTDPGHPVELGRDVTIGHRAIVHGCRVGANTLIGMGATLLTGARIGANSLVGANALVPEGKTYPDGSLLVGSPARLVRMLDAAAIERLTQSARSYVVNWRRFRDGLHRIEG